MHVGLAWQYGRDMSAWRASPSACSARRRPRTAPGRSPSSRRRSARSSACAWHDSHGGPPHQARSKQARASRDRSARPRGCMVPTIPPRPALCLAQRDARNSAWRQGERTQAGAAQPDTQAAPPTRPRPRARRFTGGHVGRGPGAAHQPGPGRPPQSAPRHAAQTPARARQTWPWPGSAWPARAAQPPQRGARVPWPPAAQHALHAGGLQCLSTCITLMQRGLGLPGSRTAAGTGQPCF
jgi:hypothetical protein